MLVVGLTGPTGAGKSTVMEVWRQLGAACMDCDAVYHRLLREDKALLADLQARFPAAFSEGMLDRKALGRLVFADPTEKEALEAITHPAVIRELRRLLEGVHEPAAVVEAIALFGSGACVLCDFAVSVLAPKEERLRRIMARDGLAPEYAQIRVDSQPPDDYYKTRSDFVLYNDAGEKALRRQAKALYHQMIEEETGNGGKRQEKGNPVGS